MVFKRITLLCCLCLVVSGCGTSTDTPPRAAVRGIVKLDGDPLSEGVIRFIPSGANQGPKSTVTIREGIFNVDEEYGPVVGMNRIEIESTDDGGYAFDDEQALERLKKEGVKKIEVVKVPPQYNKRSTLTKSISAEGENDFTFELTSTKK
ncbi:hypothetical protein Pan153_11470 [Gimesia panareensis]|uniref:Carboxypeptidase regulatory-like domain-containing protein n=1 Tax=Gimesia panareensis TaxID=2527978 RepID=A0A518FJJ8_9PLAN|nr:hypothetical protein [Gimesia panareensis]QDV16517.1 hypothetical protein Pan153_11470 [Gimesia panareensis]